MENKKPITLLLPDLEKKVNPTYLTEEESFCKLLSSNKPCLVYFMVDWSVYETISRFVVFTSILELENRPDIHIIDCSDQSQDYLENWLKAQDPKLKWLYAQGHGELLLIKNGALSELIKFPFRLKRDEMTAVLKKWLDTQHNEIL